MTGELTMHTLGGLALTLNSRSLTPSLSRKAQAMLVYLACQPRPVGREVLTTLLWEESPAEQGLTNLRKTLFELRRLLPDHVLGERQTVGLEPQSPLWLDAAELSRLLPVDGSVEMAQQETAVSLYRGPFLADFALPDCPEFMLWVAVQREQYQQLVIRALHSLANHCLRQRRYDAGVAYAQQLVQLEPLSEMASRTLMLLLARSGQAQAALAEYERCRQQLAAELGVEPTAVTQALLARIETAGAHPPALPFNEASFVGREAELAQINQYLADPACRWLTIVGAGGVGKTRLALQTASEWAYDFLHGVYFVSLTAVDSPITLIHTIAASLNAPLTGAEPPQQQLLNYLRQKEMLLLLDNCETLLSPNLMETADLLPEILRQAPLVRLIITSRERFNYQAERVVALPGLPLTAEGAVRLFVERAMQVRPDFAATPDNLPALHQICRLVEGVPLAIELAAARLVAHSPQQIAVEIAQTLDFLQHDGRTDRHSSLRAVFESAWQHLSAAEQAAFARLALFPGGFTAAAASAVAAAALPLLLSLLDKSMLRLEGERYYLHELLRQFAGEKLSAAEKGVVEAGYGRYYAHFLQQQSSRLRGDEQQQALLAVGAEIDNVRAGWQWLITHGSTDEVAQALSPLHRFYDIRGWFVEGEAVFRLAVAQWQTRATDAAAQVVLGRLLARQGFFLERLGELETAVACLQASLPLLQGHDSVEEAFALNHLGLTFYGRGAYEEAEAHYRRSLEISRLVGAVNQEAITLLNLGALRREQGQYQTARGLVEESLWRLRRSGDQQQIAIALQVLGSMAEAEGAYVEAQAHFRQGLVICEQLGDRLGRAILCASLSNITRQQEQMLEAQAWGELSLALFQEIGDPWGIAVSSVRLGEVALVLADYEHAQKLFQSSLEICREMGDERGTAVSLCNLAYVSLALGLLPQAEALFVKAVETAVAIQFLPILLKSVAGMAHLRQQTGEPDKAITLAVFVQRHPATDDSTREKINSLLASLLTRLSAEERDKVNGSQLAMADVIRLLRQ